MVDPRDILLVSYTAVLFTLAVYCLILALVNRRSNPVMVSGAWDSAGLLLAISGLLLVSAPAFLHNRFAHSVERQALADQVPLEKFWWQWWAAWLGYYLLVVVGAAVLIWVRRQKTVIYNVDPALFGQVLDRCLQNLGFFHTNMGRTVLLREWTDRDQSAGDPDSTAIQPGPAPIRADGEIRKTPPFEGSKRGRLEVDPFPAMCNVTIHWRLGSAQLRIAVEDDLRRNLDECRTFDNPSAGWFMGLSSLFFGFAVLAIILARVLA